MMDSKQGGPNKNN